MINVELAKQLIDLLENLESNQIFNYNQWFSVDIDVTCGCVAGYCVYLLDDLSNIQPTVDPLQRTKAIYPGTILNRRAANALNLTEVEVQFLFLPWEYDQDMRRNYVSATDYPLSEAILRLQMLVDNKPIEEHYYEDPFTEEPNW